MNQVDGNIKKERVSILLKLSKQLEENYMNKFLNNEVVFIPEVYDKGFIKGHTGNYLLIKTKGKESDLNKDIKVKIEKIEYPYCIGKRI